MYILRLRNHQKTEIWTLVHVTSANFFFLKKRKFYALSFGEIKFAEVACTSLQNSVFWYLRRQKIEFQKFFDGNFLVPQ